MTPQSEKTGQTSSSIQENPSINVDDLALVSLGDDENSLILEKSDYQPHAVELDRKSEEEIAGIIREVFLPKEENIRARLVLLLLVLWGVSIVSSLAMTFFINLEGRRIFTGAEESIDRSPVVFSGVQSIGSDEPNFIVTPEAEEAERIAKLDAWREWRESINLVFGPQTALTATVLGFYFGSKSK